jgi:quercetin dioxygenase-like cupin family protein
VSTAAGVPAEALDDGVEEHRLVPRRAGSALALGELRLAGGARLALGSAEADTLLYAAGGSGRLQTDGTEHALAAGSAAFVAAGEGAAVSAGPEGLELVHATVGPECDRHAALGSPVRVVHAGSVGAGAATGSRSFQVLFGPENGCTRATLFLGAIPPGRAPWHYHLYDEIVWVASGPGRLHLGGGVEELPAGAAFRLSPRELHVVENAGETAMTVLGLFTPAGSPSAAYLPREGAP